MLSFNILIIRRLNSYIYEDCLATSSFTKALNKSFSVQSFNKEIGIKYKKVF